MKGLKASSVAAAITAVGVVSALAAPANFTGPVEAWAPPGISTSMFESHPAFDPITGDLYFVRSSKAFTGWRILTSRCTASGWSTPVEPPFAGDGAEADPFFTPDGRSFYFISTRSTDGIKKSDLDIWRIARDAKGRWGTPERLPAPVNSSGPEWFPRLAKDGWLYFGSNRPGGLGKTDIWRAREHPRGHWAVENLGPAINSADDEYESLLSPDGKTMIIQAGSAYYQSRRHGATWSPRVKMGIEINGNGSEIGALFSPSGRSLMFARDMKDDRSGELYVLHAAPEPWPKPCPARPLALRRP